ncbi:DUF4097 family beta strand repeat-containing protein [Promicromonospora iranensis]|uniref:DUF4097 family beta strand repeat-containing protein n=1 Tax=Promicromonospora iranensis TaxID=1105144 RepID=UPI0023A9293A|nr:DUF4097 family beta strand repeat-containing protein [Promicromonospora iranensis]
MYSFNTPNPISTVLDVPAARVQLIAADRADTVVEVLPADAAKGRDIKAAEQTTVEYADGVLRIVTPVKHELLGSSGAVEVTVQLPSGSDVEGKAATAELRGVGRFGDVNHEAYGAIKIDEAATVRLSAQAGDVSVGRLAGSGEVSTMQGHITVTEAVSGKVVLTTQAGNVSVGAAAGVSASLEAGTTVGRIQNALKNTGAADLEIHATTTQGDISARSL